MGSLSGRVRMFRKYLSLKMVIAGLYPAPTALLLVCVYLNLYNPLVLKTPAKKMSGKRPDLKIHIIAPSSYEDDGRLRQYSRILMSPPALDVLSGISLQTAEDLNFRISIAYHNERIERGDGYLSSITNDESADNSIVVITAKSFEIPRAIDIARELRRAGKQVVLGGPGVTLADCKIYQYLIEEGIPFNVGEGENTVGQIIQDALTNKLKSAYWQRGYVDMRKAPLPVFPEKDKHNKTITRLAALGTSEGCPFGCSFCSVIKIRGRRISAERSRNPDDCVAWIEEVHARGFPIMLTDDNFRMSYTYEALQRPLIRLNEKSKRKGRELYLFVQLDARPDIINEADILAAMGVKQVFFGMETNDPAVLANSKKKQNKPERYRDIVDAYHRKGIVVGTGVMVGFPSQTPDSIQKDIKAFSQLVDLAHPYTVIPLPGTPDYIEAVKKGEIRTWDLNSYDGTHFVRDWFENMTTEDAKKAYHQSFFDLFPLKNLLHGPKTLSLKDRIKRCLYGRGLAEWGKRRYDRPFHVMMDGIPHIPPGPVVRRPVDGFTGFPLDPQDPAFADPKSYDEYKEQYLLQVAWNPQEAVAA